MVMSYGVKKGPVSALTHSMSGYQTDVLILAVSMLIIDSAGMTTILISLCQSNFEETWLFKSNIFKIQQASKS